MNGKLIPVILFLIGLIVGGGASMAVSSAQYTKLEARVNVLETKIYDELLDINKKLAFIEGQLYTP